MGWGKKRLIAVVPCSSPFLANEKHGKSTRVSCRKGQGVTTSHVSFPSQAKHSIKCGFFALLGVLVGMGGLSLFALLLSCNGNSSL